MEDVEPLHEIPLPIPNQIHLHPEGNNVVPNKKCRSRDYGENEKNLNFQIPELTIKHLGIAPKVSSAKDDTQAKNLLPLIS